MTETTVESLIEEASEASYHPILEIWEAILSPAREEKNGVVTPQWANRIVSSYQEIRFKDMVAFRDSYFSKILDLLAILEAEIEEEPESLNVTSAAEDVEINTFHYLNVLFAWQRRYLLWELEWSVLDEQAPVELAALAEIHKMFFGQEGVLSMLDQIGFEFTEDHKQILAELLEETRKEVEDAR